jgi:hypothetical protein
LSIASWLILKTEHSKFVRIGGHTGTSFFAIDSAPPLTSAQCMMGNQGASYQIPGRVLNSGEFPYSPGESDLGPVSLLALLRVYLDRDADNAVET